MTLAEFGEVLMYLAVIGGIAYGWSNGWNPLVVGIALAVTVVSTYLLTPVGRR